MHPKKYRSHSARPRGQNSTPWGVVPVETLPDPKEEPSKSENDRRSVGAKKRTRPNQLERCSTPPRRASQRMKKKPRKYSFQEEEVTTEFGGIVDPKNRGKRSVRPRGNKPASTSWAMSLNGFQNLGTAASKLPSVGSQSMKSTTPGTGSSLSVPKDMAKVEESSGEAVEQTNVADGLAEVVEGNEAGANRTDDQTSVAVSTSLDTKDSNHGGDNAAAELKPRNGTCANSDVHTSVLKESNVADALARTDVQTDNDPDPLKDNANGECDYKTISGLDLVNGNVNFNLSSAESALASLYGESDRDICIEFAVKLLMNETPLPKEVAEIEDFFTQKIHGEKSAKRLRQDEPSNSCSVLGNLQSDKLLLTSRCY